MRRDRSKRYILSTEPGLQLGSRARHSRILEIKAAPSGKNRRGFPNPQTYMGTLPAAEKGRDMRERKGLDEIVVRPRTMGPLAVGFVVRSRQDDDPHGFEAVLLGNPIEEIQAGNLGQIEIED